MTRVLIASETELVRRGLEGVVASSPALQLVGSLREFSELGASILEIAPDVVLVALESGLDDFLQMGADWISGDASLVPALIVLASDPLPSSFDVPAHTGIRALLPTDASTEEILAAITAAAAGLIVLHPSLAGTSQGRAGPRRGPVPELTGRELQILTMLAEGLGNKEIAWQLKISEHTVKFHISSIFNKLDVSSRAEAVSLGFRFGLILI
jgi:NarL family two-component system response regulator YdfI